jgi:NhaP-type Na+/H+ and K+/H+ antiporter
MTINEAFTTIGIGALVLFAFLAYLLVPPFVLSLLLHKRVTDDTAFLVLWVGLHVALGFLFIIGSIVNAFAR